MQYPTSKPKLKIRCCIARPQTNSKFRFQVNIHITDSRLKIADRDSRFEIQFQDSFLANIHTWTALGQQKTKMLLRSLAPPPLEAQKAHPHEYPILIAGSVLLEFAHKINGMDEARQFGRVV